MACGRAGFKNFVGAEQQKDSGEFMGLWDFTDFAGYRERSSGQSYSYSLQRYSYSYSKGSALIVVDIFPYLAKLQNTGSGGLSADPDFRVVFSGCRASRPRTIPVGTHSKGGFET